MNKKIKRIIAMTLIISGISAIEPAKYLNLITTKAYAEVKGADLEKISLGRGSINFKHSKTSYTLTLDNDIDELEVRATPVDKDNAEVKINGSDVYKDDNYEKAVNLDKGENTITIKVQNGSKKKTYTLTVIRGHVEDKQIYLKSIALSNGDINFFKETTSYDVNVNPDISKVTVRAIPEDEDYDVEINGITASDDDNYKNTVALVDGKNTVKIKIKDDNEYNENSTDVYENTYTLNINRGGISTTTSSNTSPSTITKGWILNNGQWSYLDESGNKQIGWKSVNNKWYYLDSNGIMKTGWQSINGKWYYLDSNGAMETGWLKDNNGKWYYLYESGAMAKNTTISGYRLGSTGVWIK